MAGQRRPKRVQRFASIRVWCSKRTAQQVVERPRAKQGGVCVKAIDSRFLLGLFLAAAAATPFATPFAQANGSGGSSSSSSGSQAQIQIEGSIPAICQFTTLPTTTSVGQLVTDAVTTLGSLGFTCNLATVCSVNLTVKSANGALKRDGGSETVPYSVAWNVQGSSDVFQPTAPWTTAFAFTLSSGAAGVQQLGVYKVKITGPTNGAPAGTYRDTITYTISP